MKRAEQIRAKVAQDMPRTALAVQVTLPANLRLDELDDITFLLDRCAAMERSVRFEIIDRQNAIDAIKANRSLSRHIVENEDRIEILKKLLAESEGRE